MKELIVIVLAAFAAFVRAESSPLVLFGAQSGKPTKSDVTRTLETAKQAGYSDFIVYPRSGLEYEYMGEEWLTLVGEYLAEAERLGMHIWLYDEYNWPSGSCAGRVPAENPDWRSRTCAIYRQPDGSFDWRMFFGGPDSANVFDVAAMNRFRELTHEVYEKRFRRYFGTVIRGIFTDEPGSEYWGPIDPGAITHFRWYRGLEEDYRLATGRDFRADVEAFCLDKTKDQVWADYTAVIGRAFRRAFSDPITAWCDRLGIVSTGHLMLESQPDQAAYCNGLTLNVLKGLSKPAIDEIYTRTKVGEAEWLTLASIEHAVAHGRHGGAAELFALGPCDISFDRMLQMIWLTALHRVDTYFVSLHFQSAGGFLKKPHYAMFSSPLQPWFFDQAAFHDAARTASVFARKPFHYDVAVRYAQREFGRAQRRADGKDRSAAFTKLLGDLESRQLTVRLLDDDETAPEPEVKSLEEALGHRTVSVFTADGEPAADLIVRRYLDGTAVVLDLGEKDRALVYRAASGAEVKFTLLGRGLWIYRPVKGDWTLSTDRPTRQRIRFLSDGTARLRLETPERTRFAVCRFDLTNGESSVTLDGTRLRPVGPADFLGFGYDKDYLATDYLDLAAGEHVFTCRAREDRGLFLPLLWMERSLPDAKGALGPLRQSPLADFAGKVTYAAEVDIPTDVTTLVLETGRAAASVTLGGRDLGTVLVPPFRFAIPAELRARRLPLAVTVVTSVRPMFGPSADAVPGALPPLVPAWVKMIPSDLDAGLLDVRLE